MVSKQLQKIAFTAIISVICFRKLRFTATEVASQTSGAVSHDTIQRLLANERARWSKELWKRSKHIFKERCGGYLVFDDTVIGKDKQSWKTEMTSKLWSASEKRYLYGQSVVLLLWTDGRTRILLDVRFKVRGNAKTKLDLALEMLRCAKDRGIKPEAVLFDSWYGAAKVLKAIEKLGWHWVTKLKSNRTLDGKIQVKNRFKTTYGSCSASLSKGISALIVKDGNEFFATSRLDWKPVQVKKAYRKRWVIEEVIKVLKSHLGFETCQARKIPPIKAHAFLCLICFNELEFLRLQHNISTIMKVRLVLFNQPVPLYKAWNLDPKLFA